MKKYFITTLFVFLCLILIIGSFLLANHPLSFFVLKGQGDSIQAFKINVYLNFKDPAVESILLSEELKKRGVEILIQKNGDDLEKFSKSFGAFSAVIGIPVSEEGFPDYLGKGFKWLKEGMISADFDNLQWADRLYLAFATTAPSCLPPSENELAPPLKQEFQNTPQPTLTPLVVHTTEVVRVEILNGCGITKAADWFVKRISIPGIIVVDSGNADNFQYPKTLIRVSGDVSPILEKAMGRLGLTLDCIQKTTLTNVNVDAVIIVGKDFPQLKGRKHARNHK